MHFLLFILLESCVLLPIFQLLGMLIVRIIFLTFLYVLEVKSTITAKIHTIVPVDYDPNSLPGEVPILSSSKHVSMYVFGENLKQYLNVAITKYQNCESVQPVKFIIKLSSNNSLGLIDFIVPSSNDFFTKTLFYICIMQHEVGKWVSQGSGERVTFFVYQTIETPYISVITIILCFTLSSIMSGLNLGLMSLDTNELHLLKNSGTKKEKKYAKKIIPIRKNGNFLLCTLVITGTLCNAISTISIDNLISDTVAVALSTVIIVLFCEILPQSICTYYPLDIGAHTVYLTLAAMVVTAPISYPLSKVFNFILRKEMSAKYSKARLKELLKFTKLPTNEEIIISGTLDLSQKKVEDVMTPVGDIFMLPVTAILDLETITSILASGYSRIPIYVEKKSNICYILLTKDLALIDPQDNVPVKALVQNSKNACIYMSIGMTVDKALLLFKDGRMKIAFVVDDRFTPNKIEKRVIGLLTFEDVIEEIFQSEINDETDTVTDNRIKKSILDQTHGLLTFLAKHSMKTVTPSDALKLATYQFLSGMEIFSAEHISPKVLLRLLDLDVFYTTLGHMPQDSLELYVQGVPADYFIMVLEGHMEVKFGSDDLKFEAGPFRYFGIETLLQGSIVNKSRQDFIPDYTLKAVKKTMYLKVPRVLYEAAVLATRYERLKELPNISITSELYTFFKQLVGRDFTVEKNPENPGTSKQN